ncbi:hypothetical protein Tco_0926937 [Tanacetum coccineum]|uniref:Uncharacterized protein n=1 Tax=Tanacetum coccineum TaxID=301880 RepID=A0ABQ5DC23_9ASTR
MHSQPMYVNNAFSPQSQIHLMEMRNTFNQQYGYRPHISAPPNPNPSQSSQRCSPLNPLDLEDDKFESLFSEAPSQPVVEESPIDEVAPIKHKYVKRRQPAKNNEKGVNELWTPDEEIALCKTWINTSEDNKEENGDEEVEETRPVGRDKTKRMGSTFAARMRPSAEYLGIEERELEMQDQRRREEAKLEILNLAQANKF